MQSNQRIRKGPHCNHLSRHEPTGIEAYSSSRVNAAVKQTPSLPFPTSPAFPTMASLTDGLAAPAAAALLLLVLLAAPASAANFTCSAAAGTTCQSVILYTTPNATTYGDLVSRFNTTTLPYLLGANGLPESKPSTTPVAANSTVRIPFRCRCDGKVGQSDHLPVYVVQPLDGLDAIARNVFNAFVTYQEIAAVNNISDPNKIYINQTLWIPLPCSCDKVEGSDVMHLAYSVASGENTSAIATSYGVTESTLLKINHIDDPKKLQMGQILDVPLPVCRSSISDTSADHNLMLLPDGTYGFTAGNCIRCSCSSTTYQLNCTAVERKGCPSVPLCNGTLKLGETNGTGCGSTMCAYSGYSNSSSLIIQTSLATNQTTACQKGGSGRSQFAGSMWSISVISFHMVLIIICFI